MELDFFGGDTACQNHFVPYITICTALDGKQVDVSKGPRVPVSM